MKSEPFFLRREDCGLLVIDIQERLCNAMDAEVLEKIVRNSGILIDTAKELVIPILVTEQYRKGLGETIEGLKKRLTDINPHEKIFFDCTRDSQIKNGIEKMHRKTLIVCGIEAHVCVLQTALSIMNNGFSAVVASDAVCSRRKHDWNMALQALRQAGALIYPTETIAFMLLEKAGTPEFKKLSPLFK